jgi:hypothetical protein
MLPVAPLVLLVTHILFQSSYWAPIGGGPITPIVDPPVLSDSAFDGERYLIVTHSPTAGVSFGIYDQGAIAPRISQTLDVLDPRFEEHTPIAVWNGSHFLVFWMNKMMTHAAVVTRDGVIESRHDLIDYGWIDDAAANGQTIALIRQYNRPQESVGRLIDVILLDNDFRRLNTAHVGSIATSLGGGSTYLWEPTITAFGDGYYAAWVQMRTGRYEEVVGTRITSYGAALDVRPSTREQNSLMGKPLETHLGAGPQVFDLQLIEYRSRILAVIKREYGYQVTASAIDAGGGVEGPVHVGGKQWLPLNATAFIAADGLPTLAWFEGDRIAEVHPFETLIAAPRRRSSRH